MEISIFCNSFFFLPALVKRLSSVQRERERTLASELRKVMNENKQLESQLSKTTTEKPNKRLTLNTLQTTSSFC